MDAKAIALIIAFAALAIVLNPVRIPSVFWPGFNYRLWEIPIITAFLLFGPKCGISVAVLNGAAQIVFFPGPAGAIVLPWGVVLMLSMFLGIYIASKLIDSRVSQGKNLGKKPIVYFTAFGTLSRVVIMLFVDYGVYLFLLPIVMGRTFTDAYIIALMPAMVIFNITVPLYSIPVSYLIAKTVSKNLEVGKQFL